MTSTASLLCITEAAQEELATFVTLYNSLSNQSVPYQLDYPRWSAPVQGTYLDADPEVYTKLHPDPEDPQAAHLNISLVTGEVIVSLSAQCSSCVLLPYIYVYTLAFLLLVQWPMVIRRFRIELLLSSDLCRAAAGNRRGNIHLPRLHVQRQQGWQRPHIWADHALLTSSPSHCRLLQRAHSATHTRLRALQCSFCLESRLVASSQLWFLLENMSRPTAQSSCKLSAGLLAVSRFQTDSQ